MNKKKLGRIFIAIILIYTVFTVGFYFLASDQIKYYEPKNSNVMEDADSISTELNKNNSLKYDFINSFDRIQSINLVFSRMYHSTDGYITVVLYDKDEKKEFLRDSIDTNSIKENSKVNFKLNEIADNYKNQTLTLEIYSTSTPGSGVSAMINHKDANAKYQIGNRNFKGAVCFAIEGKNKSILNTLYWYIIGSVGLVIAGLFLRTYLKYNKGIVDYIASIFIAIEKYKFLISQLVIRDFKSKYKRSVFGVFWSFLNPLLTMTVQFLVFSTFFKADTNNYPIYLLCGVVCFSFFSECTSMCLTSISGNSRLITKVYIPKYIFPLSRTISSAINLAISLVPLFLACLVLGLAIKPQAILFFYFLACLIIFSLGVGMFLSALMVFFRDIQFLWTVLIQIWNYATPIFYPAEIVPDKYKFILRFNPLYHFIGNARTCLMNGISPAPMAYVYCFLFAFGSLAIGAYTFKKTQDRFALYV